MTVYIFNFFVTSFKYSSSLFDTRYWWNCVGMNIKPFAAWKICSVIYSVIYGKGNPFPMLILGVPQLLDRVIVVCVCRVWLQMNEVFCLWLIVSATSFLHVQFHCYWNTHYSTYFVVKTFFAGVGELQYVTNSASWCCRCHSPLPWAMTHSFHQNSHFGNSHERWKVSNRFISFAHSIN